MDHGGLQRTTTYMSGGITQDLKPLSRTIGTGGLRRLTVGSWLTMAAGGIRCSFQQHLKQMCCSWLGMFFLKVCWTVSFAALHNVAFFVMRWVSNLAANFPAFTISRNAWFGNKTQILWPVERHWKCLLEGPWNCLVEGHWKCPVEGPWKCPVEGPWKCPVEGHWKSPVEGPWMRKGPASWILDCFNMWLVSCVL